MCTWTVPTRIPHEDVCQSNGWLWNLSCTEPSRHRLMCNAYSNTIVNYSFPKKQFFFARWSYGVLLWETVTLGKNESTSSSYQVYKRFPRCISISSYFGSRSAANVVSRIPYGMSIGLPAGHVRCPQ